MRGSWRFKVGRPITLDIPALAWYTLILSMKKLLVILSVLAFFAAPKVVFGAEEKICTQPYGSGVVCGVHTVVETGLGENLAMAGAGLIGASGVLQFFAKKLKAL